MKFDVKKFLILNFPYVFMFWFFDKVGEGYRLAAGADMVTKAMGAVSGLGEIISHNPLPSFNPQDLLIGLIGAAVIRAAVYMKAKNAKKYRHGVEYGSARWGRAACAVVVGVFVAACSESAVWTDFSCGGADKSSIAICSALALSPESSAYKRSTTSCASRNGFTDPYGRPVTTKNRLLS